MDILYLKPVGSACTELKDTCEQLSKAAGLYSIIDLQPSDSLKKYIWLKSLKLVYLFLHCIYSSGNNYSNAYFVPDNCLDQALKNSQMVVEEVKRQFKSIT